MILLDPAGYRRQAWRNGLGVSEEIAAEPDGDGAWTRLVWSLSRTGFDRPLAFSDLSGIERIITVVEGGGLLLRARDGGADIAVPPLAPTGFDGGRALEGVPDGAIRVVNLMGRRGQVRLAVEVAPAGLPVRRINADHVLLHAFAGDAVLTDGSRLPAGWTLRCDGVLPDLSPRGCALLIATIARVPG